MKKILFALFLILFCSQARAADFTDLVFAGYQAWFRTSCDSEFSGWEHWPHNFNTTPAAGNLNFDLYPDISEYAAGDLCATSLPNFGNGSQARLYAAGRAGVINKHFQWLQQYGVDGVALQRFLSATTQNGSIVSGWGAWRDQTLQRVRTAAEATGRSFYVMIDISGANGATLVSDLQADVLRMEGLSGNPLGSANYARQGTKPVIAIWGCGFSDRSCTIAQTQSIITWLKGKGYYVMGGIPHWWHRSDVDPEQPNWVSTYLQYDAISPWSVGAYLTYADIDNFYATAATDKAFANSNGVAYINTIWPGGSTYNWGTGGTQNQFPRNAGAFFWRQAYSVKNFGGIAYIAMLDEYDEATAILNAATDSSMIPTGSQYFLTLGADGTPMSSNFYLRLASDATKMLKGTAPLTLTIPTPFFEAPPPGVVNIARSGSCVATGTSCTLNLVSNGDLVVTFAYRSGSTTAPGAAANNTSIRTGQTSGGQNQASYRLSCRRASSSGDSSSGVFTNATAVVSIAYSGTNVNATADCQTTGIGARGAQGNGVNWAKGSTTVSYQTLALQKVDNTAWVAGFMGGNASATCTPGSLTNRASSGTVRVSDSNATVNSFATGTCGVTSETWMSETLEILPLPAPPPGDVQAPSVPGGLVLTPMSSAQINLAWTPSTDNVGVTEYRVERCLAASCSFIEIASPASPTYNDTGLLASTTYGYRIRAGDLAGNLSGFSAIGQATTAASSNQGLLTQNDLTYIGAFRIPFGNFTGNQQTFEYSGGFVSGNVYEDPVNGKSLFIPGLLGAGYVSTTVSIAQVKIPASILDPNTVGLAGLTTATVVQNFDDPSNGAGTKALPGNGFGTLLNYGGKIIGTESVAYDATCTQTHSAWVSSPNFANKATATGPYAFDAPVGPRWIGGAYMAPIPSEWQSALGGKIIGGSGPWSIVSCGSPGPTAFVIDADYLITQPSTTPQVPTIPLVYYVENSTQATLGHWNSNDPNQVVDGNKVPSVTVTDPFGRGTFTIPYEDNAMRVSGALFPEGARSILFFGYKGLGPYCYGEGTNDPNLHGLPQCELGGTCCYDPDGVGGKGDHSYPYTPFVWAYDVNDLIAAKNGTKVPWNVYPYTGWTFKFPLVSQSYHPVGVSWDPATRRAYMVVAAADSGIVPVVHVFTVNTQSTPAPSGMTIARRRIQ